MSMKKQKAWLLVMTGSEKTIKAVDSPSLFLKRAVPSRDVCSLSPSPLLSA